MATVNQSPISSKGSDEIDDGWLAFHSMKKDAYACLPKCAVMSFARNQILNHTMEEARTLLKNFVLDKRMPPIFMFKFSLLVFNYYRPDDFRSFYLRYLMPFFNKLKVLDIDKRDLLLQLLSLMVESGQDELIQDIMTDPKVWNSSRKMNRDCLKRTIVSMKALYRCYCQYIEYWTWHRIKHIADTQTKANIIIMSVEKDLLTEDETCLDFIACCLAQIFTYSRDFDFAVEFFSKYARKHQNNLSAQLHLYHFLEMQFQVIQNDPRTLDGEELESSRAEQDRNQSLRLDCYQRMKQLDPANRAISCVCSFVAETPQQMTLSLSDSVKDLMAFLDYGTNKSDEKSWTMTIQHLQNLLTHDRLEFDDLKTYYLENYHDYWEFYHFNLHNLEKGLYRPKVLFCSMINVCEDFIDHVIGFLDDGTGLQLSSEVESLIKLRDSQ